MSALYPGHSEFTNCRYFASILLIKLGLQIFIPLESTGKNHVETVKNNTPTVASLRTILDCIIC